MFKIRLSNPRQEILDGILFLYALTNRNIAGITFFKTNYFFVWVIMAILLAKSDVNGLKETVCFCRFELKVTKTQKNQLSII